LQLNGRIIRIKSGEIHFRKKPARKSAQLGWSDSVEAVQIAQTGRMLEKMHPASAATMHTSLYLPRPVHDALCKIAYDERIKIHDLVVEGIDAVLKLRGYPSFKSLKAGKKR
jgi:hypothetical protein